jgi:cAMP-dependent protein kinase regulator
MTLKFLGAGEMFGELEILKAHDLCRQFSVVSTFETNNVYSVSKRDFLRVLYCD